MAKFSLFFFSLSLVIPQFGLLSHVSSLRLPSGHSGPVLTLSNAAPASLFSSCLLVADSSIWATSPLGVAIRHVGFVYLFIYPPGYAEVPTLRFHSEIPTLPTDPPVREFPCVWKLLFYNSLMGWVSILNSFVSLFTFCILSYLLLKTMGCLSGCLVSSASVQKLFCEICSVFKCSFDEFVGEKMVSPSCLRGHLRTILGVILGPPLVL